MRRARFTAALIAAATTILTVVGLLTPARALYSQGPLTLGWTPSGPVWSSVTGNGVVYVGGRLDGTGGIAAVDATTGDLDWFLATDGDVRALALSPDGTTLYAGGAFLSVDGQAHARVAAVDVEDHTVVASFRGRVDGVVRDLVLRGGRLYLGGRFGRVDGVAQRGLGAMDAATGSRDPQFTLQTDGSVFGLALWGQRLLVSGAFGHVGRWQRWNLAEIDVPSGAVDPWAPMRLCSACDKYWDVATDGTNVYVATSGNAAGAYTLDAGLRAWRTIRADGDVQALWLPGDGRLYLGGHFGARIWVQGDRKDRVPVTLLAAVSTRTGRPDPSWTPKLYTSYPGIWTITGTPGALWVGGAFTGEQLNGADNRAPYLAAYPTR